MRRPLIIGLIVIVVIGGGFVILHNPSPTKTPAKSAAKAGQSSSNQSSTGDPTVQTKTDPNLGQYLADPNGDTLYTYAGDSNGVSNCTGGCLSSWPPYAATPPPTTLQANITVIKRTDDGSSQYAYNGMPLYYFANDKTGQVTGDSLNNFHVARP